MILNEVRVNSKDTFWTPDELEHFQTDLWKTTEQFETELRAEKKATDIIRDKLIAKAAAKENDFREKTLFYIEALETAMVEIRQ